MQTRRGAPEEHPTAETGRGKQIRRVRLGCEPQRDRVSRSLCSPSDADPETMSDLAKRRHFLESE